MKESKNDKYAKALAAARTKRTVLLQDAWMRWHRFSAHDVADNVNLQAAMRQFVDRELAERDATDRV